MRNVRTFVTEIWFRRSVHKCVRMDHNDNTNEIDKFDTQEVIRRKSNLFHL